MRIAPQNCMAMLLAHLAVEVAEGVGGTVAEGVGGLVAQEVGGLVAAEAGEVDTATGRR